MIGKVTKELETYWKIMQYFEARKGETKPTKIMSELDNEIKKNEYGSLGKYRDQVLYILSGKRGGKVNGKEREYDVLYRIATGEELSLEKRYGQYVDWGERIKLLEAYLNAMNKKDKNITELLKKYAIDVLSHYLSTARIKEESKEKIEGVIRKYSEEIGYNYTEEYAARKNTAVNTANGKTGDDTTSKEVSAASEEIGSKGKIKEKIMSIVAASMIVLGIGGVLLSRSCNNTSMNHNPYSSQIREGHIQSSNNTQSSTRDHTREITVEDIYELTKQYAEDIGAKVIIDKDKRVIYIDKLPERTGYHQRGEREEKLNELISNYKKYLMKHGVKNVKRENVKTSQYGGASVVVDVDGDGKSDVREWFASYRKKARSVGKKVKEGARNLTNKIFKKVKEKYKESVGQRIDRIDGKEDGMLYGFKINPQGDKVEVLGIVERNNEKRRWEIKETLREELSKRGYDIYIKEVKREDTSKGPVDDFRLVIEKKKTGEKQEIYSEAIHVQKDGLLIKN